MNQVYQDLYKMIWKQIFPGHNSLPIDQFKKLYTQDLQLPIKVQSNISKSDVYSSVEEYGYKKFISEEENQKRNAEDNFIKPKTEISSLDNLIENINDIAMFRASRSLNSDSIEESDDIYSSSFIYNSTHLHSCHHMMWCHGNKASEYLMACSENGESSFGIRLRDSGSVSNSFDMHWCGKSSNCYFCSDCFDLRDCMFCFHIVSKQYCIGNMQFEKEEYGKLKQMLLGEYFKQLSNDKAFISIKDLG
jgi:hypothetical protein